MRNEEKVIIYFLANFVVSPKQLNTNKIYQEIYEDFIAFILF